MYIRDVDKFIKCIYFSPDRLAFSNFNNISKRLLCIVLLCFCIADVSNAQTDIPKKDMRCVRGGSETLKTMKSLKSQDGNDILVMFNQICEKDVCKVIAKLADSKEIAAFTLDPQKCFRLARK